MKRVNLVFDGFPGPEKGSGTFIEAEDFETGHSVSIGYWWKGDKNNWNLTIMVDSPEEHASGCALHTAPAYTPQQCDCGIWNG